MFQPVSAQSVAETRTKSGFASGQAARTSVAMRSSRRARFSKEPPYSSSRRLEAGERNSCSR